MRTATGVVAPPDRQRVEGVAERAGTGQQQDAAAGKVDAVAGKVVLDVLAQAAAGVAEVVAGLESGECAKRAGKARRSVLSTSTSHIELA